MLQKYDVLEEKSGARVAHFKWTVAISGKRLLLLSCLRNEGMESCNLKVDDEEMMKIIE